MIRAIFFMESKVFNSDCLEGMKQYPDKWFDLAVCDPPYGLGDSKLTQGGTWAAKYKVGDAKWDIAPNKDYFDELFRISKNQIIFGANYFQLPPSRCYIIWDKIAHLPTMADCEFAWTSFDANAKIIKALRATQSDEVRIHICQKPVKVYDWIYKNYLPNGGRVLDTHGGSMSNLIAGIKAGNIEMTVFEIDTDYYKDAKIRVENFQAQGNLFGTSHNIIWH
jgi:site-specific DNA-methyltransferase (adenine-specific)